MSPSITREELARLGRKSSTVSVAPAAGELLAVWVPGALTNPLNGSHGHWEKHRLWAKDWRERAGTALLIAITNRGRFIALAFSDAREGLVAMREIVTGQKAVTFIAYVAREWDEDNLRAGLKPVRDALKDMRVIDDDKPSAGHTFTYEQRVDRTKGARRGVEIRVRLRDKESRP